MTLAAVCAGLRFCGAPPRNPVIVFIFPAYNVSGLLKPLQSIRQGRWDHFLDDSGSSAIISRPHLLYFLLFCSIKNSFIPEIPIYDGTLPIILLYRIDCRQQLCYEIKDRRTGLLSDAFYLVTLFRRNPEHS